MATYDFALSMPVQRLFMDPVQPECTGLEGDAAGDTRCTIVINPVLPEKEFG